MKKVIISGSFLLLGFTQIMLGQNFTYTAPVTSLPGTPSSPPTILTEFYSYINNLDVDPVTFWVHIEKNIPLDWDATFCTTVCWANFVLDDSNYTIAGNSSDTVLVDVYPGLIGTEGWVTISVLPLGSLQPPDLITFHVYTATGVENEVDLPASYKVMTTYPNPFNASVSLRFELEKPGQVTLAVFDLQGREVERVYQGEAMAGEQRFEWQPVNLASGLYLVRLQIGPAQQISKVLYLR